MLRLLPALLLALLVLPASASAAPKCAKNTIVIGPKKKPRACLAKTLPAVSPAVLRPLVKGKPNRRLEQLARREFRARAAQDTELPAGVTMEVKDGVVELRNKAGAGYTMGLDKASTVPDCPQANGNVPARLDETMTFGFATAEHGRRTWTLVTMRNEATWTGHVGVGARAETVDIAFRGELTIKSGVEIAATGKVVKRNPTRTYRSAVSKNGLPVKFDVVALARELTVRGPKGKRGNEEDLKAATGLVQTSVMGLMEVQYALEKGDKRWYDERACAVLDFKWSPDKVVKGGRADWNAWVNAQDGTRAADARWTLNSTCGAISATTLSGATVAFGVDDSAGAWVPESEGACAKGEITSTAGRPREFSHYVAPLQPSRYRYTVKVTYNKTMGTGIAETNATGSGTVTIGPGDGLVEGTGTFSGTEWDGTITNPCGHDMARARGFSSSVAIGGEIDGDQVTIAFTAVERAFEAAWIITVPVTGGEQTFTSTAPFCGTPDKAVRTTKIVVTATPVT